EYYCCSYTTRSIYVF
nr:immunoglobulin light chain junction region [Macaca mulatta]